MTAYGFLPAQSQVHIRPMHTGKAPLYTQCLISIVSVSFGALPLSLPLSVQQLHN